VEDLVVPFTFIRKGDPEPAEWLAQHPDAIRVPAVLVPRAGADGEDGIRLKVDLNNALERMAQQPRAAAESRMPKQSQDAPPGPQAANPRLTTPPDPISAHRHSEQAIRDYVAAAGETTSAPGVTKQIDLERAILAENAAAPPVPGIVLAADTKPASPVAPDLDKYLSQGVRLNPDGTIKEMMVLVVTRPDGTKYTPTTRVKNAYQSKLLHLPIGTEIPIPAPKSLNPEAMVDDWTTGRMADPLLAFAWTWGATPSNDFKRTMPPKSLFDAYGNFEYGATGAAKGFTRELIVKAPQFLKLGQNDPVNQADLQSGYDAIQAGGQLSEKVYVLPSSAVKTK